MCKSSLEPTTQKCNNKGTMDSLKRGQKYNNLLIVQLESYFPRDRSKENVFYKNSKLLDMKTGMNSGAYLSTVKNIFISSTFLKF